MKYRLGFVSNSSSSSFIIGYAKVIDSTKFMNWVEKNNIKNISLLTTKEILSTKGDLFKIESFRDDALVVPISVDKNEVFVIVDYGGNEGDSYFYHNEDYDIDYNISLNFFDSELQDIIKAIQEGNHGLSLGQVIYGAGRNG